MSDRDVSVEPSTGERKLFGKHKWRGKFHFSVEDKISKSHDIPGQPVNDLVGFLAPSSNTSTSDQTATSKSHARSPLESRRPSSSTVDNESTRNVGYQRRKAPRRQGLRVAFDPTPPFIIGEGGDESELPSIDIAKSKAGARSWKHSQDTATKQHARRSSPPPAIESAPDQGPGRGTRDGDNAEPPRLQRRSTGFHDAQDADNSEVRPKSKTLNTPIERHESSSSPNSEGNSETFATIYAEYAEASPVSPQVVGGESSSQSGRDRLTHKREIEDLRGSSLKPFSPDFGSSFQNSLTPFPSSQRPGSGGTPPTSYGFPAISSSETPDLPSEDVDRVSHAAFRPERREDDTSAMNPTIISPPLPSPSFSTPPLKSGPMSLRTVAKNLGGDALNEFTSRVQRFYGIFRLGACVNRALEDISFEHWIRAGTWWFLKGRGELENAVRGRPGSRDRKSTHDESDTSTALKQAYINLAKATWIILEATSGHREFRKYGSESMNSLLAIAKSFGDLKFAELIETHLAITTSMRALTMSMRRNNKMPPADLEAQGLDSRIWLDTPRFASGVASLLSVSSSRSLLDNGTVSSNAAFPFPVGDTGRHFNYGNMFVDVIVKSSDDSQKEVRIACVLSVLRERNDRDLKVVLASQDGQISLVIDYNKRRRPTWRDVHWQAVSHCVLLRLSDSLELEIQFSEHSFRSLWGTYDYTRKIRKHMEATESEEIAFTSTVKCVHYVDTPDAKVFPTEPVQHCDVRLFAKSLNVAEGSGRRKFYDGHRLMVVTPPSSKNLSHVNQPLGKQSPILFSYVRGDGNGHAMLLKNDIAGSTIVITFNDAEERENFLSQLNGTYMTDDEMSDEVISIESMRINVPTNDENPVGEGSYINSWRWQQLRVFNKRPERFENGIVKNVLSENLRIWVQCEAGTFMDRMNLGEAA